MRPASGFTANPCVRACVRARYAPGALPRWSCSACIVAYESWLMHLQRLRAITCQMARRAGSRLPPPPTLYKWATSLLGKMPSIMCASRPPLTRTPLLITARHSPSCAAAARRREAIWRISHHRGPHTHAAHPKGAAQPSTCRSTQRTAVNAAPLQGGHAAAVRCSPHSAGCRYHDSYFIITQFITTIRLTAQSPFGPLDACGCWLIPIPRERPPCDVIAPEGLAKAAGAPV